MANKKDEAAGDIVKNTRSPAPAPGAAPDDVARFEAALSELEQIVSKLERGELKLEESLKLFERGVALTKQCRRSLDTAELKIKQLLGANAAPPDDSPA